MTEFGTRVQQRDAGEGKGSDKEGDGEFRVSVCSFGSDH